jgi:hypothetical protein
MDSRSRRGFAAFSLVGLLIVIVIIVFLVAGPLGSKTTSKGGAPGSGTGGSYIQGAMNTKRMAAKEAIESNVNQICIVMANYRTTHDGKLPKTLDELEIPAQMINDQWGNPMTWKLAEAAKGSEATEVIFHSAGRDEVVGTADDVEFRGRLPF